MRPVGRTARPGRVRWRAPTGGGFPGGWGGSWEEISDLGGGPERPADAADYLDPDERPRRQFGDAGSPRHPIVQDEHAVGALVHTRGWHPDCRRAEPGDL